MYDKDGAITEQFTEAYEQYASMIYRHCYYHLGDTVKAEEALQETFLRTWEYLKAGKVVENMKTFLFKVATNLIVDEVRRRKRKGEVSLDALHEQGFDPGKDDTDAMQKRLDVWHTLQELKERKEYDLLVMRYLNGMRPSDIAAATGLKRNTVAVRLHRIVKGLGDRMFRKTSEKRARLKLDRRPRPETL
jgi:RNA polymerase sigma-70 factor (ECF subfamily)